MLAGQTVIDKIVPTDALDTYPTHAAIYGLGGHRTVATTAARNAIPTERREEGMTVYVIDVATKYKLEGGITNADWLVDSSGSGGGSAPIPTPTNVPVFQTFIKDAGYTLTYQLTDISNGGLTVAFDPANIQTIKPVEVVFANGKPVYDNLFPRTQSHRITATVDNAGLVTLSAIPYSGYSADIQIHFYYKLTASNAIANYYYNDILVTPEDAKDIFASDIQITDVAGNFTSLDVEGALAEVISAVNTSTQEIVIVQKNPTVGQFSSINDALASITDNSITKPYLISVAPGVYTETAITMKPYVYIEGQGEQQTVIQPSAATGTIITGVANSKISNLQLTGASGVGGKAINCSNMASVNPFIVDKILFGTNETQINASSTVAITLVKVSGCTTGGLFNFTDGFVTSSSNPAQPSILIVDGLSFLDVVPTFPSYLFKSIGTGAQLVISNALARTGSGGTAIYAENGAEVRMLSSTFRGFQYGLHVTATGSGPLIRSTSVNFENTTYDVFIENVLTTGYLTGHIDYLKQNVIAGTSFFISNKPIETINVEKSGGDYTSIAAAVNGILDASVTKPYLIRVGAGEFTEPVINLQSYVSIEGSSIQTTAVIPDGDHHVFNMATNSEVSFLTVKGIGGAAPGKAAFYSNDTGNYTQAHKISIFDCDIAILVEALTQDTVFYGEYIDVNGVFTNAAKMYSPNAFTATSTLESFYTFADPTNTGTQIVVDGALSEVVLSGSSLLGSGLGKGVILQNDGYFESKSVLFESFTNAIEIAVGSASDALITGSIFELNTLDINILSAAATGNVFGGVEHQKIYINPSSVFYIAGKDLNIVTVAKRGGDYLSIADAINDITDSSATNPYLVKVGPGVYTEALIDLTAKPYITVEGTSITNTVIEPDANNHHVFDLGIFNDISNLTIKNVGAGFAAINMENIGVTDEYSRCHRVDITDCDIGIRIYNSDALKDVMFYSEFVTVTGTYTYGTYIENAGGMCACLMSVHYTALPLAATTPTHFYIKGADAELEVHACMIEGSGADIGFNIQDGVNADISATIIDNVATAFNLPNIGTASTVNSTGVTITNSTNHLNIAHTTSKLTFSGTLDHTKVTNASNAYSFIILDNTTGEVELSKKINMTFDDGTHTDLSTILIENSTTGIISGGALSDGGGFDVDITSGYGYYYVTGSILRRKDWTATSITLSANVNKYIYFNNSGVLSSDVTAPDIVNNIVLGQVVTNGTGIEFINISSKINAAHASNSYSDLFKNGIGAIYSSGSTVTENVTALHLDVSSGLSYIGTIKLNPSGGTDITFKEFYRDGVSGWTITGVSAVKVKYDDNSGTLQNPPTSDYVKHALFVVGEGSLEQYFLVIGQTTYTTILAAQQAPIPSVPDYFDNGVTLIANIIVRQGTANIVEIQDARPTIGFKALGTSASSDHQSLTNRATDDAHAQYLLRSGTNAMTADLDLGGFTITNNAALPGTTTAAPVTQNADQSNTEGVASTKARSDHVHNIPTATPVSVGTANAQGSANTFAKSDHVHSHGAQTSGTHHAVATGSVAGFMSSADFTKLAAIGGARVFKSGTALGSSFAGNPKKITITFGTPFASTAYSINITGSIARTWSYESKAAGSFVINANANAALTGAEISWNCVSTGETVE